MTIIKFKNKIARQYLKSLETKEDYNNLLDKIKLKPIERSVCDLYYLDDLSFMEIGEKLGFSENRMKVVHREALCKISALIKK